MNKCVCVSIQYVNAHFQTVYRFVLFYLYRVVALAALLDRPRDDSLYFCLFCPLLSLSSLFQVLVVATKTGRTKQERRKERD